MHSHEGPDEPRWQLPSRQGKLEETEIDEEMIIHRHLIAEAAVDSCQESLVGKEKPSDNSIDSVLTISEMVFEFVEIELDEGKRLTRE